MTQQRGLRLRIRGSGRPPDEKLEEEEHGRKRVEVGGVKEKTISTPADAILAPGSPWEAPADRSSTRRFVSSGDRLTCPVFWIQTLSREMRGTVKAATKAAVATVGRGAASAGEKAGRRRKKLLYLSTVWPEPRSSAAGVRTRQLLDAFQASGWVSACGCGARTTPFRGELEEAGISTYDCRANSKDVEKAVRDFRPDVVVFERFNLEEMFGWQVRETDPGIVRIIDTQDLNTLRQEREKMLAQRPQATLQEVTDIHIGADSVLLLRELSAIHRSDAALIVSDYELDMLVHKYSIPPSKLQLAPFFYDDPPDQEQHGDNSSDSNIGYFDRTRDFVFIGNFRHSPNADAVRWSTTLWPMLSQRLQSHYSSSPSLLSSSSSSLPQFHVYGAYPRKEDMALTSPETGFIVKGPTPDQYKTLSKYRVLLAPLRVGAGIKGKIADAWWCGLPVVTTPIGAEGMGWRPLPPSSSLSSTTLPPPLMPPGAPAAAGGGGGGGDGGGGSHHLLWGGLVGASEEEIVDAAVRLYADRDLWLSCRSRGREILSERFGKASASAVVAYVDGLMGRIEEQRRGDVMQAMLWMQQHRSTEYMSRWLALKGQPQQQQQQQQEQRQQQQQQD